MMNDETRTQVDRRLKRAAGQVAGIQKMVENDRYCVDVLIQIAAARAALAKVSQILLESHIQTCVVGAMSSDDTDDQQAKIAELLHVFDKYI